MSDAAIRVGNLSKRYRVGLKEEMHDTLVSAMIDFVRQPIRNLRRLRRLSHFEEDGSNPADVIWALDDVSFEVEPGEVVGIIGRNGAGKTTLLKVLSRITEPTKGRVEIRGRISSLLEVGTGFHGELTGRENIYLNGTILGMRKTEIERKFDEIVDFSGVEKFIDTPVKRYSSGMGVRLAFAVAAHLEPEIMLIDEVLAVGDAAFQRKCLGKMGEVSREGRTVLFVSHNMAAVSSLCRRCIWLDGGSIVQEGNVESAISAYLSSSPEENPVNLRNRNDRKGDGSLRVTDIYVTDVQGRPVDSLVTGKVGHIYMAYESDGSRVLRNVSASLSLDTVMGQRVLVLANEYTGDELGPLPKRGIIRCTIPIVVLNSGLYTGTIYMLVNGVLADWVIGAVNINVQAGNFYGSSKHPDSQHGNVLTSHSWDVLPVTNG